jgi:ribosome maturation factor RimP
LCKPRDFERVVGQKIRVGVQEPIEGQRWFEGKLARLADGVLELETGPEHMVRVPLRQVQKAKLKFE